MNKSTQLFKFNQCPNESNIINDNKHQIFASIKDEKVINTLLDSNCKFISIFIFKLIYIILISLEYISADWQNHRLNRLSDKLLLNGDEPTHITSTIDNQQLNLPSLQERTSLTNSYSSSPTNSQKMCVQLQITISLLAVSICFIFCTLPNCISTIMIQTYTNDEHVRQLWQAMNFFSIVPLLATHSVNLLFYYLSSNMFRERFKEYYFKKRT